MSFNTQCIQRVDCRVCRSDNLERVIELTPTPPGNNFLHEKDLGQQEELFPGGVGVSSITLSRLSERHTRQSTR
jgi:hypothetical protein